MEKSANKQPGIYREEDNSPVSQADAIREWAVVALDELIRTAHQYDAVVTYKELALLVQDASGIRTRVLITNWHAFAPKSEHREGDASYKVVQKGEETADAFAKDRLGELSNRLPILVLNDEGHHCWRP